MLRPTSFTKFLCVVTLAVFGNSQQAYSNSYQARVQASSQIFSGNWTATAGAQVYRGTWSAQTPAGTPNRAVGSWTLLNDSGEIFLQGTWTALKVPQGWQGSWTAKTSTGRSFSGSWNGDLKDLNSGTFQQMLTRTKLAEVSGSWKSGQLHGNWWLKH